jgi:predicted alpha/beta superfamily hydrolase
VDPFVRKRFDVEDEGATLFGSSMGGLFTTYALLNPPDAFDNYLAVSPALWWNDGELMKVEPTDPTSGKNPRVFFAAGGLEEAPHVPMLARFRLISNARDMAGRLVELGWPEGQGTFEEIPGETHASVVPVALTRGLRAVYRSGQ